MENRSETPWLVKCPNHDDVFLTHIEYMEQMYAASSLWRCPICGEISEWDDDNYDYYYEAEE